MGGVSRSRIGPTGVAVLLTTALVLNGCGLYFHSDDYQKKTDAAADAAEAALVTPRVTAISKEAIAAYDSYEKAIVTSMIAERDNVIVHTIQEPLRLSVREPAKSDGTPLSGMPLLSATVNAALKKIVGDPRAAHVIEFSEALETDLTDAEGGIEDAQSAYADEVSKYTSRSLSCTDLSPDREEESRSASGYLHSVWSACNQGTITGKDAEQTDAYKNAVNDYRKVDISCKTILALTVPGADPSKPKQFADAIKRAYGSQIHRLLLACLQLKSAEDSLVETIFGKHNFDASSCGSATAEIVVVMCGIEAADAAAADAARQKKQIDAQIDELAKRYKAKKPKGENSQDADPSFLEQVTQIQKFLADAAPEAKAYGLDVLAVVLKDAVAVDIAGALAQSSDAASATEAAKQSSITTTDQTAAKPDDAKKAELAGAVIRVVAASVRFGQAYEKDLPFDRANAAIIALATLRVDAGRAEIEAQTEVKRRKLLKQRLLALARAIESLDLSRRLIERAVPNLEDLKEQAKADAKPLLQPDLLSLRGKNQKIADGAISAYATGVNRGLIPDEIMIHRELGLDYRAQTMISVLTADSTDKVVKAAMETLRAYGKGGVDPNLVVGAVLGTLAVGGIWTGAL